jgi:hypothetical protein
MKNRPRSLSVGSLTGALPILLGMSLAAGEVVEIPVAPAAIQATVDIPVPHVLRPPLVDGRGLDEAWSTQPWTLLAEPRLGDGQRLAVKGCTDGVKIFLLIRFPASTERRRHRPWRWDPITQQYLSSAEEEQALTVLWLGDAGQSDAWIWRSDRTDAAGHADDAWASPAEGLRPDRGTPCWESRYVANFAGAELPRFYPREPTGSLADVRARGVWEDGAWTVELARPLETGWPDDLPLRLGETVAAHVFTGLPDALPMPGQPRLQFRLPGKASAEEDGK